jgi:hypothetical protein
MLALSEIENNYPEDLRGYKRFIRRSVKPIHRFRGLDVSDIAGSSSWFFPMNCTRKNVWTH